MDGKAIDMVGSSQGSQPPREMPNIIEADVDIVVDEVMLAKPQNDKSEGRCSISLPSIEEPTMEEAPTPQQPSTNENHVEPEGVDQMLFSWAALGIPYDIKSLQDVFQYYTNKQWIDGKFNVALYCNDQFFKDNWRTWKIGAIGGEEKLGKKKSEAQKSFLFYGGFGKEGIKIDWSTATIPKHHAAKAEKEKLMMVKEGNPKWKLEIGDIDKSIERSPKRVKQLGNNIPNLVTPPIDNVRDSLVSTPSPLYNIHPTGLTAPWGAQAEHYGKRKWKSNGWM
ncbi:hypothetical protein R1flu_026949 [Riccia fluitans]|uniref:Uncharacterized protein n=1 Tax=Riccia fluitans TaxID=41844 RepID=A0ABD1XHF8_9MARC